MGVCDKDAGYAPRWMMQLRGQDYGDRVAFISHPNSTVLVSTSSGYAANTWHHACAVEISQASRSVFIDGGSKVSDSTDVGSVSGTPDRTYMGRQMTSSPHSPLSGHIAEAAIWNVALTDVEVAILAAGYSPLFVRPQSLLAYWPLIRGLNDKVGGYSLTASGTVVSVHPRIIYPAMPLGFHEYVAAGSILPLVGHSLGGQCNRMTG